MGSIERERMEVQYGVGGLIWLGRIDRNCSRHAIRGRLFRMTLLGLGQMLLSILGELLYEMMMISRRYRIQSKKV